LKKVARRDAVRKDDVLERAAERGFQLDETSERSVGVACHQGNDWRHPRFRNKPEALRYMEERLRRIAIFE
jgi:hypothetical protein